MNPRCDYPGCAAESVRDVGGGASAVFSFCAEHGPCACGEAMVSRFERLADMHPLDPRDWTATHSRRRCIRYDVPGDAILTTAASDSLLTRDKGRREG